MMHFFRRSKIHLDCFTARRDVIEYAPVVNGMEVIPDWWKALPKQYVVPGFFNPAPTMKTCVGMYDYYNNSVAMPLWSDLCIRVNENKSWAWQFSNMTSTADTHNIAEFNGFVAPDGYGHIKLVSPWAFSTKENINWLVTQPIYGRHEFTNYTVAQGLLNFSKQTATHIQLFVDLQKEQVFTMPHRTPFLLTPLSDKEVVIHRELVTDEIFNSIKQKSSMITFINKYKKSKKIALCPYKDNIK